MIVCLIFLEEYGNNVKKLNRILCCIPIFYLDKGEDLRELPACVKKRTTYALFFYTL